MSTGLPEAKTPWSSLHLMYRYCIDAPCPGRMWARQGACGAWSQARRRDVCVTEGPVILPFRTGTSKNKPLS